MTDRKFKLGDRVTKTRGSSWTGLVVGFYSTSLTPIGCAVESENEPGSVQIYPEGALTGCRMSEGRDPGPTNTQVGVSEAGEVVAWRNWNQLHEYYYLDEVPRGILKVHDEKNEPLVRQSALTACQQEVERLLKERHHLDSVNAEMSDDWMDKIVEAKADKARILELEADLEVANNKVERLRKALEEIASDDEHGDYEGVVQFARAALGGQSNE